VFVQQLTVLSPGTVTMCGCGHCTVCRAWNPFVSGRDGG